LGFSEAADRVFSDVEIFIGFCIWSRHSVRFAIAGIDLFRASAQIKNAFMPLTSDVKQLLLKEVNALP
jgi:hypothetical protein